MKRRNKQALLGLYSIAWGLMALCVGIAFAGTAAYAGDLGGKASKIAAPAAEQPSTWPPVPGATPVESTSWSGLYVGGHGGWGIATAKLSQLHRGETQGFIDGLSGQGFVGGGDIEAAWQIPGSIWVLSAKAGYDWADEEFEAGASGNTLRVSLRDGWWVDGTVGLALSPTVKPYVSGGYTQVNTSTNVPRFDSPDLDGWRVGVGVDWKHPGLPNLIFGLNYNYTHFNDVKVGSEDCPILIEPENHTVMFRTAVKLGSRF